jgi:flagella basal body P-ring formation protein FlgA
MLNNPPVCYFLAIFALAQAAGPQPMTVQIEQAARAELEKQMAAAGLTEPQFEVAVVTAPRRAAVRQPVAIEPADTRSPQRMRFLARCNDTPGWRYEYVVRARVSAMVAVAANDPVAANEALTADAQVTIERRDISNIADPLSTDPKKLSDKCRRRCCVSGDILRQGSSAARSWSSAAMRCS